MAKIVVVGSLNMDLVVRAPRFARPGETIAGHDARTAPGGKGANQAVAARRAGGRVAMIGCVGDDAFGTTLRQGLADEGIDVAQVAVLPGLPTGVALITVDDAGENTIIVVAGANGGLSTEAIQVASLATADVVLLQLEVPMPVVQATLRAAHAARVTTILNAAPARPLERSLLSSVDYLVVNETEIVEIARGAAAAPEEAARVLQASGARDIVVTLGGAGSLLVPRKAPAIPVAAVRVDVVDTTAAGDAFVGAFAVALAQGADVVKAMRLGSAAGALAVTRAGAQPSLPARADIDRLMASLVR